MDMEIMSSQTYMECMCCIKAKATSDLIPKDTKSKFMHHLQIVHSEICEPMKSYTRKKQIPEPLSSENVSKLPEGETAEEIAAQE